MTKFLLIFILLIPLLFPLEIFGQEEGSAVYQQNSSVVEGDSVAFGESLVVLAWENYPENDAYQLDVLREEENVLQAKRDWLNDLGVSFNINEGNINSDVTSQFFPRYNLRFSISAGTVINTPSKIRHAKLGKNIAEENVDQQQLTIRREVLSRYYTYLYNINFLKLKLQSFQDVSSSYTSATQAFQRGEISLDEYNRSLILKDGAREARLQAERELLLSKLLLEEVIGMTLEKARSIIKEQSN